MIEERSLLVNYSHSHEDYRRSDVRFNGQADVELVAPNSAGLYAFLDKADRTRSDRSIEPGELWVLGVFDAGFHPKLGLQPKNPAEPQSLSSAYCFCGGDFWSQQVFLAVLLALHWPPYPSKGLKVNEPHQLGLKYVNRQGRRLCLESLEMFIIAGSMLILERDLSLERC